MTTGHNKLPSVSVAMATYNGEKFLLAQLESINKQTLKPDQLVISDDCSTDSTLEIIKSFSNRAEFPVLIRQNKKNLGSTKNFEKALILCSGDVLFLCDQDDVWEPHKIELMLQLFCQQPQVLAVFSDAKLINESGTELEISLWRRSGVTNKDKKLFAGSSPSKTKRLLKRTTVTGATMAFRKDMLGKCMPFPVSWVHDAWISLIISTYGNIIGLEDKLINYRQHADNQIGAQHKSLSKKIMNRDDLDTALKQLQDLLTFVNEGRLSVTPEMLEIILQKINHLESRKRGNLKLSVIVYNLLNLRYHKYSNGWRSFARDVLLLKRRN